MAQQINLSKRSGGLGPSHEGGPGKVFPFPRAVAPVAPASDAWALAEQATVRNAAGHFGNGGAQAPSNWLRPAPSLPLCSAAFVDDGVPACVRELGAAACWSELRGARGEAVEAARDAIALLERLEGLLSSLAAAAVGDPSAYQARLAEGLVHSLCDVLVELSDEANLVTQGTWKLLLLA